jgi:hypothetical protein
MTLGLHQAGVSLDSGGHLIACSDDGTISVTNMSSPEIKDKLSNFAVKRHDIQLKRLDTIMREREQNKRLKRSNSVSNHF